MLTDVLDYRMLSGGPCGPDIIREWDDGASKNHVKRTWCRVANHVARLVFGEGARSCSLGACARVQISPV